IGAGTLGSSRYLPSLLTALQIMKPALIFLSGSWFCLYLVNRNTRTAPLTGRVLLLLVLSGLLAIGDAATEAVYLTIPKKEVFASAGCCTVALDDNHNSRLLPPAVDESNSAFLVVAYYTVNAGLALALASSLWIMRRHFRSTWLIPLVVGALLSIAVNAVFLV